MYKFHNSLLPSVFISFFKRVNKVHNYNTRLSSKLSYTLLKVRTNYGSFNIRFQGPKMWNSIHDNTKLPALSKFKKKCNRIPSNIINLDLCDTNIAVLSL